MHKIFRKDIMYYSMEQFNKKEVLTFFSSRIGWNQEDLLETVNELFNIPKDRVYSLKQIHSNIVHQIYEDDLTSPVQKEGDGLITSEKNILLLSYHADCVPIYFYDEINKVIGVAHSGWKGTIKNVSKSMVENMMDSYNTKVEDLKVIVGPSICRDCYEVKEDLEKIFVEEYGEEIIYRRNDGKMFLDLWLANEINLLNLGILKENIFMTNYCTSENLDELFSYRVEGTKDRMIAGIMLKG